MVEIQSDHTAVMMFKAKDYTDATDYARFMPEAFEETP